MANIIESRVTLEDEVFEETIDTMEEPIEVVRPSSYNDLEDLPQVNGVTLMGNKTSEELGIVTATDIENAVSAEATLRENADTALGGRIDGEKAARENADTALGGRIDGEITNRTNADNALGTRIDNEILARQGGDNNLQTQIDAITSKSDVVDVVADYAALQAYDTQHLGNNDVIKVLDDETHNDTQTYYRWNKTAGTWAYIGSEAPYYSKSQIDQQMQAKQDKLTAGTGINLNGSTISADTTVLATKEDLEPEIVADLPAVGDPTKLYLTPTNKTATGNPITITLGEDEGAIDSFQLDGDTYQQSYEGKNLIDIPDIDGTSSSGVVRDISDNVIDLSGTVTADWGFNIASGSLAASFARPLPAGTYTVSLNKTVSIPIKVTFNNANSQTLKTATIDAGNLSATVEITDTATKSTVWSNAARNTQVSVSGLQIMVESGSSATSFEPYTGGTPSPNPDYPQPIQTVTGEQTVEIVGKNLSQPLDKYAYSRNGGATIESQSDGTVVFKTSSSSVSSGVYIYKTNGNNATLCPELFTAGYTVSFDVVATNTCTLEFGVTGNHTTSTVSTTKQRVSVATATGAGMVFYNNSQNGATITISNIQVEAGSTASAYSPYSKQTYPLDLGTIELCKLGTYQDYIYKDGDDWKVHKATATYSFTGAETPTVYTSSTNTTRCLINNLLPSNSPAKPEVSGSGLSNYFIYGLVWSTDEQGIYANYRAVVFRGNKTAIGTTLEEVQTWLTANKPILYYALATATDTVITDTTLIAQLEAIRTASLQNGANTITNTSTGANLAGSMSIGYYGYNPSEYSEWLYVDGAWEQVGGRPIPTKTSDLLNDSGFIDESDIALKLQNEVVSELPENGDEGKLYLTPKAHTTQTATGNPITASVTEQAGAIESFQLDGDTYQQTYTGKNLLGFPNGSHTSNGVTSVWENGKVAMSGTATSKQVFVTDYLENTLTAGTYTFSMGGVEAPHRFIFRTFDADNQTIASYTLEQGTTSEEVTIAGTEAKYRIVMLAAAETTYNETDYFQLELGSTSTSFEPYVGGTPSPNPDYPQPIQTVTGEQTVEIVGKNLFDKDKANIVRGYIAGTLFNAGTDYSVFMPCEENTTYTIQKMVAQPQTANRFRINSYDKIPAGGDSSISSSFFWNAGDGSDVTTHTYTTPAGAKYLGITVMTKNGTTTIDEMLASIQVELGSTASAYAPYSKQTLPINLGKNLFDKDNAVILTGELNSDKTYSTDTGKTIYIECKPNTTYSVQKAEIGNRARLGTSTGYLPNGGIATNYAAMGTAASGKRYGRITSGQNDRYLWFTFARGDDSEEIITRVINSIQIEAGAQYSSYAPYKIPIELCKLGDYQDYIYKDGEDWKVHKAIGYRLLNGEENWTWNQEIGEYDYSRAYVWLGDNYIGTDRQSAVSNYFHYQAQGHAEGICFTRSQSLYLYPMRDINTQAKFIAWLENHNTSAYYRLATATDTAITDTELIAQLEAIRTAMLQNGTNTITNTATGSNLAGDMEIGYYGYNPRNRYDKWLWLDIDNEYEQIGS